MYPPMRIAWRPLARGRYSSAACPGDDELPVGELREHAGDEVEVLVVVRGTEDERDLVVIVEPETTLRVRSAIAGLDTADREGDGIEERRDLLPRVADVGVRCRDRARARRPRAGVTRVAPRVS